MKMLGQDPLAERNNRTVYGTAGKISGSGKATTSKSVHRILPGNKFTQIHRQKNEAPTIIDTIATGYLRAGPSKSVTLPS
jgi:hypothetical protein